MATAELLDRFGLPIWVLDPGAARATAAEVKRAFPDLAVRGVCADCATAAQTTNQTP